MTAIIQEVKRLALAKKPPVEPAEALTGYGDRFHDLEREIDNRFNGVDQRFNDMERKMDNRKSALRLHQWMLGFNLALTVAVLLKSPISTFVTKMNLPLQ